MKKWSAVCLLALAFLAGCFQVYDEEDLRTVPVTNNPSILPVQGAFPGAGGMAPY